MDYTLSVPCSGSISAAVETARLQFIANGFRLDQPSETELIATGEGMYSTKRNPIVGVSHARITVTSDSVDIVAKLGGVKLMQRFLYIFPPALAGCLALIFACIPSFPRHAPLMAFLPVVPWIIISPLMARWIRTRTTKALDTLAYNMTSTLN